jgi:S-adenosylmethionine decarboxylase
MKSFGISILSEFYGVSFNKLDNLEFIKEIMEVSCVKSNMTCLGVHSKKFEPQGISCLLFLEESHISIHTWPEHSSACIDVFTCGTTAEPLKAIEYLVSKLEPTMYKTKIIERKNEQWKDSM